MATRKSYERKEEKWLQKPRSRYLPASTAIALAKKVRRTLKCKPSQCKVISVHLPVTEETREMVDSNLLEK